MQRSRKYLGQLHRLFASKPASRHIEVISRRRFRPINARSPLNYSSRIRLSERTPSVIGTIENSTALRTTERPVDRNRFLTNC